MECIDVLSEVVPSFSFVWLARMCVPFYSAGRRDEHGRELRILSYRAVNIFIIIVRFYVVLVLLCN